MAFTLSPLPYSKDALAPTLSAETLDFHHGKHHAAYVKKVNELIKGRKYDSMSLEDVIMESWTAKDTEIFNNAAQVWNHNFYWHCMRPGGGGKPTGVIASKIEQDFGSYDKFAEAFKKAGETQFGTGWAWLVLEGGKLKAIKTPDAELPMITGKKALLTMDVWEHAFYIDYRNRKPDYMGAFLDKLVNWDFVNKNLQ